MVVGSRSRLGEVSNALCGTNLTGLPLTTFTSDKVTDKNTEQDDPQDKNTDASTADTDDTSTCTSDQNYPYSPIQQACPLPIPDSDSDSQCTHDTDKTHPDSDNTLPLFSTPPHEYTTLMDNAIDLDETPILPGRHRYNEDKQYDP
jgi:hypothetical protein